MGWVIWVFNPPRTQPILGFLTHLGRVYRVFKPVKTRPNPNPTQLGMGWVDILKTNPTRDGFNPNPTRLGAGWVDILKTNPTRDGFNPNPTRLGMGWVGIYKMNPTRDGFNPNPTRLGMGWVDILKMNPACVYHYAEGICEGGSRGHLLRYSRGGFTKGIREGDLLRAFAEGIY